MPWVQTAVNQGAASHLGAGGRGPGWPGLLRRDRIQWVEGKKSPPPAPAEGRGALRCSSALTDKVGRNGDYRVVGVHLEADVGRQEGRVTRGAGRREVPSQ